MGEETASKTIFYINTGTKRKPKWEPIGREQVGEFTYLAPKQSLLDKIISWIRKLK